jgi:glycolate oxidase
MGIGISGQGTSMNPRNMLSWEFVNPKGEIVRGGSAGAGSGWFTSDGPGPGVRGMFRGFVGAGGAFGVFTKIGYKLYPVPVRGPFENTGRQPQLGLRVPENVGFFHAVWPSWERHRDAAFELTDENLCFAMLRMPPDHIGWTVTATNAEYVQRTRSGTLPVSARPENEKSWTMITLARSPAEHAWRVGVLKDIVQRTGGRILELEQNEGEVLFNNLFTSIYIPRVMRPSGGITTSFGILDSMHFIPKAFETGAEMLKDGKTIEGGREEHWTWPAEGRYFWSENIIGFDPCDTASRNAAARAFFLQYKIYWRDPVGVGALILGPLMELQGKSIGAPQDYSRAVKHYMDPTNSAKSTDFIPFTVPKILQKTLPTLRPVLWSEPVIRFVSKVIADKGM